MSKKITKIEVQDFAEEFAENIEALSDAMKALAESRLSERTIELLLRDATGLPLRDIRAVMNSLPHLKDWYLK